MSSFKFEEFSSDHFRANMFESETNVSSSCKGNKFYLALVALDTGIFRFTLTLTDLRIARLHLAVCAFDGSDFSTLTFSAGGESVVPHIAFVTFFANVSLRTITLLIRSELIS